MVDVTMLNLSGGLQAAVGLDCILEMLMMVMQMLMLIMPWCTSMPTHAMTAHVVC